MKIDKYTTNSICPKFFTLLRLSGYNNFRSNIYKFRLFRLNPGWGFSNGLPSKKLSISFNLRASALIVTGISLISMSYRWTLLRSPHLTSQFYIRKSRVNFDLQPPLTVIFFMKMFRVFPILGYNNTSLLNQCLSVYRSLFIFSFTLKKLRHKFVECKSHRYQIYICNLNL